MGGGVDDVLVEVPQLVPLHEVGVLRGTHGEDELLGVRVRDKVGVAVRVRDRVGAGVRVEVRVEVRVGVRVGVGVGVGVRVRGRVRLLEPRHGHAPLEDAPHLVMG